VDSVNFHSLLILDIIFLPFTVTERELLE